MPAPRRIAAVAVSTALLLAPAAAYAQNGAGDEQYTDPFAGGSQQPATKPRPKPQPAPVQQTTTQQQTTPSTTRQAAPSAAQQPAPQSTTAADGELPRTGFDVIPLALVGVALVAGGLLLRRRGAHERD